MESRRSYEVTINKYSVNNIDIIILFKLRLQIVDLMFIV